MTEKTVPVEVTQVEWRCPCGLGMGIPEKPVCSCGEYELRGRAAVAVKPKVDKGEAPDKPKVDTSAASGTPKGVAVNNNDADADGA